MLEYQDVDFMICAGDDKTDEDMFRALRSLQNSVAEAISPSLSGLSEHGRMRTSETHLDQSISHFKGQVKPDDVYSVVVDNNPAVSLLRFLQSLSSTLGRSNGARWLNGAWKYQRTSWQCSELSPRPLPIRLSLSDCTGTTEIDGEYQGFSYLNMQMG